MGKIVAIGGGEIRGRETYAIDQRIVELTGKVHPRALFIPTASHEAEGYIEVFQTVYGNELGCEVETLRLLNHSLSTKNIEDMILSADLIYVGGGDTLFMMEEWLKRGVDLALKKAYESGVVLSGLSAGSICWFTHGHSDSLILRGNENGYTLVDGLGLIEGIHCPHADERLDDFMSFMEHREGFALAIEANCAIEIIDGMYRILTSQEGAKAYRIYCQNGIIKREIIPISTEYRPYKELSI